MKIKFCPKCKSTDWKITTSEDFTGLMPVFGKSGNINILKCNNCGYVGIFPEVDEKEIKKVKN